MRPKRYIAAVIGIMVILLMAGPLLAGGGVVLKDASGQALLKVKGENQVEIGKTRYRFQSWGLNRLKLEGKVTHQGIFLKRLGVKLIIRNLKGNILHIIRKEGFVFRVESPVGEPLIYIKISSPRKVTLFRQVGNPLYTIQAKGQSVLIEDADGQTLYTLKGTAKTFPAAFLCISDLSWEERVACFLLYEKIPFPYE